MNQATMAQLADMSKTIHENIEQASRAAIISTCTGIAENGERMVRDFYDQYQTGRMTEVEAKKKAASYLLSQKIGETGYICVLGLDGTLLVHPQKSLVGKEFAEVRLYPEATHFGRRRLHGIPVEKSRRRETSGPNAWPRKFSNLGDGSFRHHHTRPSLTKW